MPASSPSAEQPVEPPARAATLRRDDGIGATVWLRTDGERAGEWEVRLTAGMSVTDVVGALERYLPGGTELIESVTLQLAGAPLPVTPPGPNGQGDDLMAAATAGLAAAAARRAGLEAGTDQ
jgi:hypothetical protein